MSNGTIIKYFLLMGLNEKRELQTLHTVVFFAIYLAVLVGNVLIIILVAINTHFHTPMYFFLVNLSVVDLAATSVSIPKSMVNVLINTTQISYSECAAQMLFFLFFMSSDLFLLTVMAYDRYVAICHPLHYATLMKWGTCMQLAGGAWIAGLFNAALHTGTIFSLPFCSNIIHHFFCEIPHLFKLSCSDSYFSEIYALLFSTFIGMGCLVFILNTYIWIFTAVFKMPSLENRQKAFTTCIPHITVVSLLVSTMIPAYFMPTFSSSNSLGEVLTVMYSVVPPMMNPIIYSMRNKEVKAALRKLFHWKLSVKNTIDLVHL